MLTQVLNLGGVNAVSLPVRAIHETAEAVAKQKPSIVFLSGMPPVAMARASRLYRSLRSDVGEGAQDNFSRTGAEAEGESWNGNFRVVVGIWNLPDDPARAAKMISRSEDLHISTSLADAVAQALALAGEKPAVPEPLDASPQLVAAPKDTAA